MLYLCSFDVVFSWDPEEWVPNINFSVMKGHVVFEMRGFFWQRACDTNGELLSLYARNRTAHADEKQASTAFRVRTESVSRPAASQLFCAVKLT